MLANLSGGFVGTQISSKLLLNHGWRVTGAQWLGCLGVAVAFCFVRGPHVPRHVWFGWKGGWQFRRDWSVELATKENAAISRPPSGESLDSEKKDLETLGQLESPGVGGKV